jgi:hypothetical protein
MQLIKATVNFENIRFPQSVFEINDLIKKNRNSGSRKIKLIFIENLYPACYCSGLYNFIWNS